MRCLAVLISLLLLLTAPAAAHPATAAGAQISVTRDGRVAVSLRFDVLALALNDSPLRVADGPMSALLDAPEPELARSLDEARERFLALFSLQGDGVAATIDVTRFPTAADIQRWKHSGRKPILPVRLELSAEASLSTSTRFVSVRFPNVLGDVIVTLESPGEEPSVFPLHDGEQSEQIPIRLAGSDPSPPATQAATASPGRFRVSLRYAALGFTHILPFGADHILFVLGLLLLSPRVRPLLAQVTAFTVAHSITLALALFGIVRLPSSIVEPLITASITLVAVENLFTSRVRPWRVVIVFIFGLVHGLGFAGALEDLGLPKRHIVTALVGFNLGVEAGQLAVLALAFLAVGVWRDRPWYRRAIAIPGSVVIAIIGVAWTIHRIT